MSKSPMSQFIVQKIVPIQVQGFDLSFTNSSLAMLVSLLVIFIFAFFAVSNCRVVPTRLQSFFEIIYQFIMSTLCDSAGNQSKNFFPFVFSLFVFLTTANLLGLHPYLFSFTSQIVVTTSFSLLVVLSVVISGFYVNGLGFLRLFIPKDIPLLIKPLVCFIEVSSFLFRPVSLSLRLFANMLAGHLMLKVFAGFSTSMMSIGMLGIAFSFLPVLANVAVTGLEFFVAFMQAYIFMVLACVYIGDVYRSDQH
ncbi:F0F1 ATP synthase subunit A [Candidatus Liberibacter asiaticus]|uniref:ATP synthase subunit a n=2 Tax=Liberibacter asiaticus TaxID=34021 RepID=C6XGQ8_LIBAP|nr:F0F1 ATP synthase subunit A [Candidatus Liberibacter asiaticus]ACT57561.1 F0F1 ATP synthase subunit A [Candidatus Liberibacter asiaticus str. psy62]AGH17324.1 F0F1 ATP synthase subunit A [Candidatus Liberibacter asiaticus str. gxpsy]ALK07609.1 F0F1 ATP synthase subunit A [Candidatus Liberibacter asiaticus]ASK53100.1 F0F1 ATP synthase subunit A [Candidatus Liberibacter asiaticus]AWL14425.1 F0F1 ATP synthase subunit A [Candidatus Liberibacter asiaticus]